MLKKLKKILQAEIDPAFAKRAEFVFREITKEKPEKILDAGCGRGFYLHSLSFFKFVKEIHGIDVNMNYLKSAKKTCVDKKIMIKKASLDAIPYPDNYFNFIICLEVLEHLKNNQKSLSELKRVLKKNGKLIITVPSLNFPFFWDPLNWVLMRFFNTHINKNIWWLAGIWADHEMLFTEDQLKQIVVKFDFKIEKILNFIHYCLPFSHFLLYGIGKNLVERFGFKELNRFEFKERRIANLIAKVFKFPQKFDSNYSDHNSCVNIALKLIK